MSGKVTRRARNGSARNRNSAYCSDAVVKARGLRAVVADKFLGVGADTELAFRWLDCEGAGHPEYKEKYTKAVPGYLYHVEERGGACVCVKALVVNDETNYGELMTHSDANAENAGFAGKLEKYFTELSYLHKADSYLFMDPRKQTLFTILRGGLGDFMGPHMRGSGNAAAVNSAYTESLLAKATALYTANPRVESLIDGGDLPFSEVFENDWDSLTPQELLS